MKKTMRLSSPVVITCLLALTPLVLAQDITVTEQRTTFENGMVTTCDTGEGMDPCRDANGETYQEEIDGPAVNTQSSGQLASEASKVRHETPAELEKTIEILEQGGTLGEAVPEN